MIRKVKVKDIRPNPFQPRKRMHADATKSLAEEIDKVGLWPGALRGREKNGNVELCFGHRRLEAIKLLGWKEVEVDVVKLTDEEMSLQSLIENLQREGLNDADRGDGIAAYVKLREQSASQPPVKVQEELGRVLGLSTTRIRELLHIAGWDEELKEPIRQQKIAGKTAAAAERIGGAEGVKAAAEKELGYRAMEEINRQFVALPETTEEEKKVKEKVKKSFARGKIASPDDLVKTARQAKGQLARKSENIPPDLIDVMRSWTERAYRWASELEQVAPYIEYIDSEPKVAERWRGAVGALIEKLEKFA